MSTNATSGIRDPICPSCKQTLDIDKDDDEVMIFCANLNCLSDAASAGATGPNVEVAFQRLLAAVENED